MSDVPSAALTSVPGAGTARRGPRYHFVVPESERVFEHDPHKLTLVPLRVGEELEAGEIATKAKGDANIAFMNEQVRRSVVAIDDKPVNWAGADAEWLERCGPKIRALARHACSLVNAPSASGSSDFLASVQIETV